MELIPAESLHPERDRSATVNLPPQLPVPDGEPTFEPWDGTMSPHLYRHRLYTFAGLYIAWVQAQYAENQRSSDVKENTTQQAGTVGPAQAGPVES